VRVTRNATGNVKRLSAAVVVNNRSVVDPKGKTTQVALTTEELDKMTALVRESIGYRQERGDSVKVINAPFRVETMPSVEVAWWKTPDMLDLVRSLAVPGALVLVSLLIFFGLVRPGMKAVLAPTVLLPGTQLNAVADEPQVLPSQAALPGPRSAEHLESAKLLARQNPAAVAGILRSWVGSDQPAPR
jgi:flagellar M-ring protein FliF